MAHHDVLNSEVAFLLISVAMGKLHIALDVSCPFALNAVAVLRIESMPDYHL